MQMPGSTYNSDSYRFGYQGSEMDNEVSGTGNTYTTHYRGLDPRIGRWFSVDPLAHEYPSMSDYAFVANSPILFVDIDGRVIGNPNHPDAILLKETLLKTPKGTELWNDMVESARTVHIFFVDQTGESGKASQNAANYLTGVKAAGTVVTANMATEIFNTGALTSIEVFDEAYEFNEETGEYSKTDAWNDTYILMNIDGIHAYHRELEYLAIYGDLDPEAPQDLIVIETGGEEAAHFLQEFADFHEKKFDKKTNKFIKPTAETKVQIPYAERRHEKEAKATAREIQDEYLKMQGAEPVDYEEIYPDD